MKKILLTNGTVTQVIKYLLSGVSMNCIDSIEFFGVFAVSGLESAKVNEGERRKWPFVHPFLPFLGWKRQKVNE